MAKMDRRDVLQSLAAVPVAAAFAWSDAEARSAATLARNARQQAVETGDSYAPRFFTADELATIVALVDLIIPADDRSGSASDAGVPEFIDFMMIDQPARQLAMRGGLRWLDHECRDRFGRTFLEAPAEERLQVIEDIAWPGRARPDLRQGARFFSTVRDLTATGFFTSRMGTEELEYMGNRYVPAWHGAPAPVLEHLGVGYEKIAHWYEE